MKRLMLWKSRSQFQFYSESQVKIKVMIWNTLQKNWTFLRNLIWAKLQQKLTESWIIWSWSQLEWAYLFLTTNLRFALQVLVALIGGQLKIKQCLCVGLSVWGHLTNLSSNYISRHTRLMKLSGLSLIRRWDMSMLWPIRRTMLGPCLSHIRAMFRYFYKYLCF